MYTQGGEGTPNNKRSKAERSISPNARMKDKEVLDAGAEYQNDPRDAGDSYIPADIWGHVVASTTPVESHIYTVFDECI